MYKASFYCQPINSYCRVIPEVISADEEENNNGTMDRIFEANKGMNFSPKNQLSRLVPLQKSSFLIFKLENEIIFEMQEYRNCLINSTFRIANLQDKK